MFNMNFNMEQDNRLRKEKFIRPVDGYFKNKEDILNTYLKKIGAKETTFSSELIIRDKFVSEGIYALITSSFLDDISGFFKGKNVLEVMAGRGYLARGLKRRQVSIIATDDKSWGTKMNWKRGFTSIENLDALKAVSKYGIHCDYILMSWPPSGVEIDFEVLKLMRVVNPNCKLIVIGEGNGGCTGSDKYHQHKKKIDLSLTARLNRNFESWDCINDKIEIVN